MALLLLPLVVFGYALPLAYESGPHRSAEERRRPPKTARLVALTVNVIALGWHVYGWWMMECPEGMVCASG